MKFALWLSKQIQKFISIFNLYIIENEFCSMQTTKIITVGLNPVWDRMCQVDGIGWGDHKKMTCCSVTPAGKALNINKALAWLDIPSTAAGLWGATDYPDMIKSIASYQEWISLAFTVVPGTTRQNVTVVDTIQNRELHLRSSETLITIEGLQQLSHDLQRHYDCQATIIFAGSIPDDYLLEQFVGLVTEAGRHCASIIIDTSGGTLRKVVDQGGLSMIKPNLKELSSLLGKSIKDDVEIVISEARQLCDRVQVILVSLGAKGAVAITKEVAYYGRQRKQSGHALHTVGCGDYLLAGYVSMSGSEDIRLKLTAGLRAATAKAYGWAEVKSWSDIQKDIDIEIIEY